MKTHSIEHLTPVQKTLLITLKGRAHDNTAKTSFLRDELAADLVNRLDYDLTTVKLGAGVTEGIAIRTSILDRAVDTFVRAHPDAVVVELGSGLETRMFRLEPPSTVDWYDVDFPDVIKLREDLMPVRDNVHPVGVSLLDPDWTATMPTDRPTILVADGLLAFLNEEQNKQVLKRITDHFTSGELVTNAYTKLTARLTGHYINSVGIPKNYRGFGFDDPQHLAMLNPELSYVDEQTRATAPETKRLSSVARFNVRLLAHWPAQVRHGVWVLRYQF